jgi:hypothetical protein
MSTVLAKFRVNSTTDFGPGNGRGVLLTPVTSGSDENLSFWKYTPNGKIEMTITNDAAAEKFKAGAEVFVEFQFPDE